MLMLLKSYGGWMALVAALGLAFGLYRSEIRAAEARGQAELMAEQAEAGWEALLDSVDVWEARKAASDSIRVALTNDLSQKVSALGQARESASEAILAARNRLQMLEDSLNTLTTEDLVVIREGIDSLEAAQRACEGTLGTCETLVKAADARIFQIEAEQRQSLDLNRNQALVIERLQNLRGPSIGTVGWLGWTLAVLEAVVIVVR